uniref:Integral membrane protein 2 n=1 Tax=Heliothis virescens TaxID=7102 RepID=A0A2A4K1V6_HELVI
MTVLTKPSLTIKKVPLIDENHCDEEIIEMQPTGPRKRHGVGAILCMAITVFLLVLMGVITALQIYEQVTTDVSQHNHYQGFCSIPLSRDLQMLESRKMPLRWKTTPNVGRIEPSIQVVSLMDEDPEHLFDLLREVLDIDIDDSVEKISVFNNGHPVSFIHDFETNVTGIVDSDRCFTMDLDPELSLQPELFLLGLQRGDEFDVSRVRTQLRALLPPRQADTLAARAARDACMGKPIYRLQKETGVVIRKRSADAPPHDFMQFAGKRVQEIEISNLAELLEFEQDSKQA